MLDGMVNDAVEARALSLNPNHIGKYKVILPINYSTKNWLFLFLSLKLTFFGKIFYHSSS